MENQLSTEASLEQLKRLLLFFSYDPTNEKLWLDAAQLALNLRDWETTKGLVENLSEPLKRSPLVNAMAGQILLALKQYPDALNYLLQSTSDHSAHPSVWINLAYCYFYQERFSEASDAIKEHLVVKDMYPVEHTILSAKIAYHTDDSEKATSYLLELDELHNAESAGFLSLLLFEDNQLETSMRLANLSLATNPHELDALISRASLYLNEGANDRALSDIQLAVNYHPSAGRAWSTLAQIEFSNMQFEAAKEAAEKAIEFMPNHIGTWHILGWSQLMLGAYDSALQAFEASYELDRGFGETHGGLAYTYTLMGENELAKEHTKRAQKLDPDSFAAIFAQTASMISNNNPDSAKESLNNWAATKHPKLQTTPEQLINKGMAELISKKTPRKIVN